MPLLGHIRHAGQDMEVYVGEYANGNLAVEVFSPAEGPWARVSINLGRFPEVDDLMFVVNHDVTEGDPKLLDALARAGLAVDTGKVISYGFVEDQPIWRILRPGEDPCSSGTT